jgi:hypothetical protein
MQRIEQEDAGCLRVFALASDSRFEVLHQSRCQRRQSGVGIVAKIGINGFDRMGESPRTLMKLQADQKLRAISSRSTLCMGDGVVLSKRMGGRKVDD